jgi:hypothetical protein
MSNGVALKRRNIRHRPCVHEQEYRLGIDEAADQPWHAMRSTLGLARVTQTVRPASSRADQKPSAIAPGFKAAFEDFGFDSVMAELGCNALAEARSSLAYDNNVASGDPIHGVTTFELG